MRPVNLLKSRWLINQRQARPLQRTTSKLHDVVERRFVDLGHLASHVGGNGGISRQDDGGWRVQGLGVTRGVHAAATQFELYFRGAGSARDMSCKNRPPDSWDVGVYLYAKQMGITRHD